MTAEVPPGKPGIPPHWTSSDKSGVGTAPTSTSRIWFTTGHGIINEVYFPNIDQANTRDLGFLVTDGKEFFSEEKKDTFHKILPLGDGVPGFNMTNTCEYGRYRIVKTIISDPERDVLLQQVRFEPLKGTLADYHLYVLLAPHLGNQGYGNNGWAGDYKGIHMLFAARNGFALALACSAPFLGRSCGYVGFSDGWQDINAHKQMTWFYPSAPDGNIALTGEIDLQACNGQFVIALGFGGTPEEAGHVARASLFQDFDLIVHNYTTLWNAFHAQSYDLVKTGKVGKAQKQGFDLYHVSMSVLKTHESKRFPGGMIASLSIPWGAIKGDNDLGGYHLVWPRDLVESVGGLVASGDIASAHRTGFYLMCTQNADGHWPQNMWLDGRSYWHGIQMDETALLVLIADVLRRSNQLIHLPVWPTIRKAIAFIMQNGPVTQQDRWEEDAGYSPFTLATEVAALLAAADFADDAGEHDAATYMRETADAWNANIERWTYVTGTELARQHNVEGYYIRIAPPDTCDASSASLGYIPIKNRPPGSSREPAANIISPDALALVRFGLRDPKDPRILNTVKVIDAMLKTETATGPVWHRYNDDGYGEHADGSPFDGTGIGRGWPLLAGERAHYELAAGNRAEAEHLLHVIEAQTGPGGLIPEQVWDSDDIPEYGLYNGRPTNSARPLVWAHAEYVKLLRSLHDNKVFDMPPQTVERYITNKTGTPYAIWRFNNKCRRMEAGRMLRIETLHPARVHWTTDNWHTVHGSNSHDTTLGVHVTDLPTTDLAAGATVIFTLYWPEADRWEQTDYTIEVTNVGGKK